jgi:hypothetical protein
MLTRSTEQRKNLRRFTRRAATLSLDAQRPSVDCVIWDLSQGGGAVGDCASFDGIASSIHAKCLQRRKCQKTLRSGLDG